MSAGERMERRAFLGVLACGSLTLATGGCATSSAVPVRPSAGRVRLALADHPGLAPGGGGVTLDVEGLAEPLHVMPGEGGDPVVLSAVCTHLGCVVERRGPRLVCPCHGSTYSTDGAVLAGPAPRPLPRFRSRVVDGVLEIDVAPGGAS